MSKRSRGRFAAGRKVKSGTVAPRFGADGPSLIVGESVEPLPKRAARGTVTLVLAVLGTAALFYVVLASTVLAVFGAGDRNAVVLRGAHSEGGAPAGSYLYVSSGDAAHDTVGKVRESFLGVPAGSVVRVVARPSRRISNDPSGVVLEDGKPTGEVLKIKPRLLVRQYLAVCVSGDGCGKPGDPVLVPQGNVIGGVRYYLSTDGLRAPQEVP